MTQASNPSKIAVLVVEDEPFIRLDAVDMVEEAGFRVYEAADAAEAIRQIEAHPEIEVLFTDVDMPGLMDGLHLARYVHDRWPPMKIVVTSGHHRLAEADLPGEGVFFSKPYLHAKVCAALKNFSRPDAGAMQLRPS